MDTQQGYGSPSSYIPEPFGETKHCKISCTCSRTSCCLIGPLRSPGVVEASTPNQVTLSCLTTKSVHLVIDVEKDPLVVQFNLNKLLCRRDFDRILEFLAVSVPKYTAERGAKEDKHEQAGNCKGPTGTLRILCRVTHIGICANCGMHGMHMHPGITLQAGWWLWMNPC
eukprot:scaffold826_cov335-Pavlova_lutheri.AAC.22